MWAPHIARVKRTLPCARGARHGANDGRHGTCATVERLYHRPGSLLPRRASTYFWSREHESSAPVSRRNPRVETFLAPRPTPTPHHTTPPNPTQPTPPTRPHTHAPNMVCCCADTRRGQQYSSNETRWLLTSWQCQESRACRLRLVCVCVCARARARARAGSAWRLRAARSRFRGLQGITSARAPACPLGRHHWMPTSLQNHEPRASSCRACASRGCFPSRNRRLHSRQPRQGWQRDHCRWQARRWRQVLRRFVRICYQQRYRACS